MPYFLPWRITKHLPETTHTFLGSFTLDLPIGVALLLFIWLLRVPLAAPLGPVARAKCLARHWSGLASQPVNWALAPLSILIGAWTHLVWDSFTHADGWMVLRISALSAPVSLFSYTGELCHVLQYASSVFGLAVLAIWFALLPAPAQEPRNGERGAGGALLLAGLFAAAVAAGGLETVAHFLPHITATYRVFYLLLTRTAAWFAVLYTAAGIIIVRWRTPAASVTQT